MVQKLKCICGFQPPNEPKASWRIAPLRLATEAKTRGPFRVLIASIRPDGHTCHMAKQPSLDPSISLVKMRSKKSLAKSHPDLAKEAHGWDPELVSGGSEQKLPWKCSLGHIFQALPSNRTRVGSGCPYCAGKLALPGFNDLATLEPEIAKQAHGWNPTEITAGSGKKLDWICPEGHIWNAQVSSIANVTAGNARHQPSVVPGTFRR